MRTIKFRAWDTERKDIFDVVAINYKKKRVYSSWNEPNGSNLYAEFDRVVLMQYTGLKDKNGKEIYEGDIVLCKIHDKEYMGLVEYTNTYGFYYLSGMGRSDTELWGCNEKKVIGNIYENPELIQQQDEEARHD